MNESGYVVRCSHCSHYQIYFSDIILCLSHPSFLQWISYLEGLTRPDSEEGLPSTRTVIATPNGGVHLVVSAHELFHLKALLQEAENEVTALHLMELF